MNCKVKENETQGIALGVNSLKEEREFTGEIRQRWDILAKRIRTFDRNSKIFAGLLGQRFCLSAEEMVEHFSWFLKFNADNWIADEMGISESDLKQLVESGKLVKSGRDEFGNATLTPYSVYRYFRQELEEIYFECPKSGPIIRYELIF